MRLPAALMLLAACSSSSGKPDYSVCSSNGDCSSNMCVQHFTGQSALCTQTCQQNAVTCPSNNGAAVHCLVQTYTPSVWVCWP